jgi:membrane protein
MDNRLFSLLKKSLEEFNADNGTLMAAAISFSLLFSLFPLVFIAIYIAEFFTEFANIQDMIGRAIGFLMPVSRQLIASIIGNSTAHNAVGGVALLGLVWGSFSFFNSVRISLNTVWGIHNPYTIYKAQFYNVMLMIGSAIILLLSVLLTIWLSTFSEPTAMVTQSTDFVRRHATTTRIVADILITGLAFAAFLLVYKFLPGRRPKWKDIWVGALAAAFAFQITKFIFLWYLRTFSPYNLVYGSVSTLIAFLMWSYLSALAFLFIAKVIHVNLEMRNKSVAS